MAAPEIQPGTSAFVVGDSGRKTTEAVHALALQNMWNFKDVCDVVNGILRKI
jgi:hypothetical protein